jgi:tetratricopeptide (TPR) repeat protein
MGFNVGGTGLYHTENKNLHAAAAMAPNEAALQEVALRAYGIANTLAGEGLLHQSENLYERALGVLPDHLESINNLAWVLSVQDDVTPLGKARAIELAERAVALTHNTDPAVLDTLAAAYANAGRFSKAAETATRAVALASKKNNSTQLSDILRSHQMAFEARQPIRETKVAFEPVDLGVIRPDRDRMGKRAP